MSDSDSMAMDDGENKENRLPLKRKLEAGSPERKAQTRTKIGRHKKKQTDVSLAEEYDDLQRNVPLQQAEVSRKKSNELFERVDTPKLAAKDATVYTDITEKRIAEYEKLPTSPVGQSQEEQYLLQQKLALKNTKEDFSSGEYPSKLSFIVSAVVIERKKRVQQPSAQGQRKEGSKTNNGTTLAKVSCETPNHEKGQNDLISDLESRGIVSLLEDSHNVSTSVERSSSPEFPFIQTVAKFAYAISLQNGNRMLLQNHLNNIVGRPPKKSVMEAKNTSVFTLSCQGWTATGSADVVDSNTQWKAGQVKRIQVENLRNIESLDLQCGPGINLFIGSNGVGKSTIGYMALFAGLGGPLKSLSPEKLIRTNAKFAEVQLQIATDDPVNDMTITCRITAMQGRLKQKVNAVYSIGNNVANQEDVKTRMKHLAVNVGSPSTLLSQDSVGSFAALGPTELLDDLVEAKRLGDDRKEVDEIDKKLSEYDANIDKLEKEKELMELDIKTLRSRCDEKKELQLAVNAQKVVIEHLIAREMEATTKEVERLCQGIEAMVLKKRKIDKQVQRLSADKTKASSVKKSTDEAIRTVKRAISVTRPAPAKLDSGQFDILEREVMDLYPEIEVHAAKIKKILESMDNFTATVEGPLIELLKEDLENDNPKYETMMCVLLKEECRPMLRNLLGKCVVRFKNGFDENVAVALANYNIILGDCNYSSSSPTSTALGFVLENLLQEVSDDDADGPSSHESNLPAHYLQLASASLFKVLTDMSALRYCDNVLRISEQLEDERAELESVDREIWLCSRRLEQRHGDLRKLHEELVESRRDGQEFSSDLMEDGTTQEDLLQSLMKSLPNGDLESVRRIAKTELKRSEHDLKALSSDEEKLHQKENKLLALEQELKEKEHKKAEFSRSSAEKKRSYNEKVDEVVREVNNSFSAGMQHFGYGGKVERKGNELHIQVQFHDKAKMTSLSAQTHSGGEKSVSTAVYLMAVQSSTQSPFCCFDEISQALDPQKEQLMFHYMMKRQGTQSFFITPKHLPSFPEGIDQKKLHVHCLTNGSKSLSNA